MVKSEPRKICFVGLDNYPVINPDFGDRYIGGESVQQTLLARAFRDRGYDVTMVVKDIGQPLADEVIDGIRLLKTFRQTDGLPILRFIHPRMTSIFSALSLANADIYYQSCAGTLTGYVANFCARRRRTFIFRVAHDTDCIPGEQLIRYRRDRMIYEYGLRRAHLVAAQGTHQQDLLKQHYSLDSTPINMTVEIPELLTTNEKTIDVLWINNLRPFKCPELVLELARKLPTVNFSMIGGPVVAHTDLYESVRKGANELPNLTFHGQVPYHSVNNYISSSKLFINTSESEGFPNSFLQAWARAVPVISFFDPDGLIAKMRIGEVPKSIDEMAGHISTYLLDQEKTALTGQRSREFIVENYGPAAVIEAYESEILGN